jgi:N-acetylglutamate synthase-like GNAT family acetyltransferase
MDEVDIKIVSHCSKSINPVDVKKIYDAINWKFLNERTIEEIGKVMDCNCYAAWHENKMIGFVRYLTDGNFRAYIEDMLVLPDYRSKGVGQLLLKKSLEDFQEIDVISLFCTEDLIPFYEKLGFELSDKQRVMLSAPVHFLRSRLLKNKRHEI